MYFLTPSGKCRRRRPPPSTTPIPRGRAAYASCRPRPPSSCHCPAPPASIAPPPQPQQLFPPGRRRPPQPEAAATPPSRCRRPPSAVILTPSASCLFSASPRDFPTPYYTPLLSFFGSSPCRSAASASRSSAPRQPSLTPTAIPCWCPLQPRRSTSSLLPPLSARSTLPHQPSCPPTAIRRHLSPPAASAAAAAHRQRAPSPTASRCGPPPLAATAAVAYYQPLRPLPASCCCRPRPSPTSLSWHGGGLASAVTPPSQAAASAYFQLPPSLFKHSATACKRRTHSPAPPAAGARGSVKGETGRRWRWATAAAGGRGWQRLLVCDGGDGG